MSKELQFNKIYKETKDFGRTQFVREIQMQINDNKRLQQENKELKEQLLVAQTNEETFRLEMVDITKILGLDEHTIFDDVKAYIKILKDNWNKLKKDLELVVDYGLGDESSKWDKIYGEYAKSTLKFMQELEQGSDSNE